MMDGVTHKTKTTGGISLSKIQTMDGGQGGDISLYLFNNEKI